MKMLALSPCSSFLLVMHATVRFDPPYTDFDRLFVDIQTGTAGKHLVP